MHACVVDMELVGFTLIVDDIVYPDGTTRMGVLGGGGTSATLPAKAFASRMGR